MVEGDHHHRKDANPHLRGISKMSLFPYLYYRNLAFLSLNMHDTGLQNLEIADGK